MKRREALHVLTSGTGVLSIGGLSAVLSSCGHDAFGPAPTAVPLIESPFERPLPVLPVHAGGPIQLVAQASSLDIRKGASSTSMSYGGSMYGPTIVVRRGEGVDAQLTNQIGADTNIHWHGLLVPAEMDGHPMHVARSGASLRYTYTLNQRACHAWYHSHVHGETGRQITMGLAGNVVVRDAEEDALRLPSGNDEFVLVLQDKRLDVSGNQRYAPSMMEVMNGYMGEVVTVNGIAGPIVTTSQGRKRLRIVNASTARVYNLGTSDGRPLTCIGTDQGLLAMAEDVQSILLAPGERVDVLLDLRNAVGGEQIYLETRTFDGVTTQGKHAARILRFDVTTNKGDMSDLPTSLALLPTLDPNTATRTRTFDISNTHGGGHGGHGGHEGGHTINGIVYAMTRSDVQAAVGGNEIWEFDNTAGAEIHPMHVHGATMRVLRRTGGRGILTAPERGIKDTVLCMPGERVRALVSFGPYAGMFLLHCHLVEHSDDGMMLNLELR